MPVLSALDVCVCDVCFSHLVGGYWIEEFTFRTNNAVFRLLWLNMGNFSIYSLYLFTIYGSADLSYYLDCHVMCTVRGTLDADLQCRIHHI